MGVAEMLPWRVVTVVGWLLLVAVARAEAPSVYVLQWGSPGTGDGQFNSPISVAVDAGGYVYVADSGNHRIQKFTGSGLL